MPTIEKVIPFDKLTLTPAPAPASITYNGTTIELRTPSSNDIYDLIAATILKSNADGVYNPFLVDVFFHLNLVYIYTKITFSAEDRADEIELYDKLNNSGLMQEIINAIPEKDYNYIQLMVSDTITAYTEYNKTFASIVHSFVNDLPMKVDEVVKLTENFDPTKFQAVLDFARAANGGNPIISSSQGKTE